MLSNTGHRIRVSRIYRFATDQGSVLYDDGKRLWTINGSKVKHFEWEDLEGRQAQAIELDVDSKDRRRIQTCSSGLS